MKSAVFFLASGVYASYGNTQSGNYNYGPSPQYPGHYTQPYYPKPTAPYHDQVAYIETIVPELPPPYVNLSAPYGSSGEETVNFPALNDFNCLVSASPFTKCGRRSLTSYFLEQCMTFHFHMTNSVEGVCGTVSKDSSKKYVKSKDYLGEKCNQKVFSNIITATTMCLTENEIRIQFIEQYSRYASRNPIEGPILYLKKIHAFMGKVMDCAPNGEKNFPTLYQSFNSYNPNSPFEEKNSKVSLYQNGDGEASGMEAYTLGDHGDAKAFLCSNVEYLKQVTLGSINYLVYSTIPSTFYSIGQIQTCQNSLIQKKLTLKLYRACGIVPTSESDDSFEGISVKDKGYQFITNDLSLKSFYDAVHPYEKDTTALRRPLTIAEIAVSKAGTLEQPILEGFGIMYYCAFYACKANNGGDMEDTCFPAFSEEDDFPDLVGLTYADELEELSETVHECIANNWLTARDIALNDEVVEFNKLDRQRSYVGMAQTEIINFMDKIIDGWNENEDAITLVYARSLADEYCSLKPSSTSNTEMYESLRKALVSLDEKCTGNQEDGNEQAKDEYYKNLYEHQYNQFNQYNPQGSYH
jgi:hypothetical protein